MFHLESREIEIETEAPSIMVGSAVREGIGSFMPLVCPGVHRQAIA